MRCSEWFLSVGIGSISECFRWMKLHRKKLGFVFDRTRVFIDKQKIISTEIRPKTVIFYCVGEFSMVLLV